MKKIRKILSILNGVLGDTLAEKKSSLATKMTIYHSLGHALTLTKKSLHKENLPNTGRICLLAHGNCGSESGWDFKGTDATNYGSLLQEDFGFTPYFLRYNSGLHISTNGKHLSNCLEKLVDAYPQKLTEIILLGHSMGGLVFRSACYYGQKGKKKWVKLVRKIFYIGTPHLGTHLEKLGKLTTTIFKKIPTPFTKAFVLIGDLRSAGVKDLRHGYLTDEDWQRKNSDDLFYWPKNKTPLLKKADHYLICGTLSKVAGSKMGRIFGDGLVHPASGTGQGLFAASAIPFLKEHCKVIPGISHQHLQRSRRVYEQIKNWCEMAE